MFMFLSIHWFLTARSYFTGFNSKFSKNWSKWAPHSGFVFFSSPSLGLLPGILKCVERKNNTYTCLCKIKSARTFADVVVKFLPLPTKRLLFIAFVLTGEFLQLKETVHNDKNKHLAVTSYVKMTLNQTETLTQLSRQCRRHGPCLLSSFSSVQFSLLFSLPAWFSLHTRLVSL